MGLRSDFLPWQGGHLKKGILLINLGSTDAPESGPIRRFLCEFLFDPRVIDISALGRWLLLNLIILPFRPRRIREAYRMIWTDRGSPIIFHTKDLADSVQKLLDTQSPGKFVVRYAMRYGRPGLDAALKEFSRAGIDDVAILPLYPQYAAASTATTLARVYELAGKSWDTPNFRSLPAFFDDPGYLRVSADIVSRSIADVSPRPHILFSFHGLPERQILKSDPVGGCLKDGCCENPGERLGRCYRAQSYATARGIAKIMGLADDAWSVSFQSRLGRTPWIKPYTDLHVHELIAKGITSIAVACPSFTADCLETLEEVAIRLKNDFLSNGGLKFVFVPSLNSDSAWASWVAEKAAALFASDTGSTH